MEEQEDATRSTVTTLQHGRALSFSPPLFQGHSEANLRGARAVIRLVSFSPHGDTPNRGSKFEGRTTISRRRRQEISTRIKIRAFSLPKRHPVTAAPAVGLRVSFPARTRRDCEPDGTRIYATVTRGDRRCALRHVVAPRSGNEGKQSQ